MLCALSFGIPLEEKRNPMLLKEREDNQLSGKLIMVAVLVLALHSIGTAIAIVRKLPADAEVLGVTCDPNTMLTDFLLLCGTALSPPLILMLVLVLFVFLCPRTDRWGTFAVGGITVLGLLFTFGALVESITWRVLQGSMLGLLNWGSILSTLSMLVFSILELGKREKKGKSLHDCMFKKNHKG
jgi:hypothetical protein